MSGNNYAKWDLDASNKRLDDFKKLIVESRINATSSSISSNSVTAKLSSLSPDYLYYISSKSVIRNSNNTYDQIVNVVIPTAMKGFYVNSKVNTPWLS